MTRARSLPEAAAIAELVTMLVGKNVRVTKGKPLPLTNIAAATPYVDDTGKLVFVGVMDLAFCAGIGAALAMFPRSIVDEALKAGKPSEAILENAQEVMNIAASLFNDDNTASHVKVKPIIVAPYKAEINTWFVGAKGRLDCDVVVAGYPDSKLTFVQVR